MKRLAACAIAGCFALGSHASAQTTVFSTFVGDSWNSFTSSNGVDAYNWYAAPFTVDPSESGSLYALRVASESLRGSAYVSFGVGADVSTANWLQQWDLLTATGVGTYLATPGSLSLSTGNTYWVMLWAAQGGSAKWFTNPSYYAGTYFGTYNGGSSWYEVNASYSMLLFDVSVTSTVPEPASLALLGTGLLALASARRRKRR